MILIDAEALMNEQFARLKDGEVLYRIPPSAIYNAPALDPVHAAGGCYCRECKFYGDDCVMQPPLAILVNFCSYGQPKEAQDDEKR